MLPMPIYAGYSLVKSLLLIHGSIEVTDAAAPLLNWLQLACVRQGATAETRVISKATTSFAAPVVDAQVSRWAASSLAPFVFRAPVLPLPLAALPANLPRPQDKAILGGKENSKAVWSQSEKEYLLRFCGMDDEQFIHDDDQDSQSDGGGGPLDYLPRFYGLVQAEGKTKVQVHRLVVMLTAPSFEIE